MVGTVPRPPLARLYRIAHLVDCNGDIDSGRSGGTGREIVIEHRCSAGHARGCLSVDAWPYWGVLFCDVRVFTRPPISVIVLGMRRLRG
jgi:hypothetical protein